MRNYSEKSTTFVVLGAYQDRKTAFADRGFRAIESLRNLLKRGTFIGASCYAAVHLRCLWRDVARGAAVLDLAGLALSGLRRHRRPMCRMSLVSVRTG